MTRTTVTTILLAAILGSLTPAARAATGWWTENWIYRRSITVHAFTPTKLPGDDIAVIEFYAGGLAAPDGSDIRVVTPDGTEIPSRILMSGPGDSFLVAFSIASAGNRFFLYYGNPKPSAPAKPLAIQRGILQETWAYAEGGIKSLQQVQSLIPGQKDFIGRSFRERIFQGHNPFGQANRLASLFTGYFIAPEKGGYVFASSSQDASFLLIDDKLIIDNGGHHRPQTNVSSQGIADLEPGLHKLSFYHVCTQGEPIVVAAWKPPTATVIKPMPPVAFTPVATASVGPLERYGKDVEIEAFPIHAGETFAADRYFQRYVFEALATGSAREIQWQWDFGDGQKSTSAKAEHVYLTPGEYKVTLTAKTFAGTLTRTNRVLVDRPWDLVTENKLDPLAQHAQIVADYDFAALPAENICQAIVLLNRAGARPVLAAGDALIKQDKCPSRPLAQAMTIYTDALVSSGQSDKAISALLKAWKMSADPAVAAELLVKAGQIAIASGDAQKAQQSFDSVIKTYAHLTTSPAIQQAQVGLGDAWRLRGDYDKARQAYATASAQYPAAGAVTKGDLARHVEDYIRRDQLDSAKEYLDKWEQFIPADKLEGYLSLLKCRYFIAANQLPQAAAEAEILVKVNPASNYAPELLTLAAEAYKKQGKPQQARACLQMLVDKYKESPLATQAAKKL